MEKDDKVKKPKKLRAVRVRCDQCEVLVINNVVCHEFGCPNKRKGK